MKKTLFTLSVLGLVLLPALGFASTSVPDTVDPENTQASTRLEWWNNMTKEERAKIKNGYSVQGSELSSEEIAAKEKKIQARREAFAKRISTLTPNRRGNHTSMSIGKDIQSRLLEAGVQLPTNWNEMSSDERRAFMEVNGVSVQDSSQDDSQNTARPSTSRLKRTGRSFSRGFSKQSSIRGQRTRSAKTNKLPRQGKWDFQRNISQ